MAYRCGYQILESTYPKARYFHTNQRALIQDASLDHQLQCLCKEENLERALEVLVRVDELGISISPELYFCLLKSCKKRKALALATQIFDHITKHRSVDQFCGPLADCFVLTFGKCGAIREAHNLFCELSRRSVFSWMSLMSAYLENGRGKDTLILLERMQNDGVEPNQSTFISLFKACGIIPDIREGRKLHVLAKEKGIICDAYVVNTLVGMYAKCGSISEAEKVFIEFRSQDVVSWNVMLTAYSGSGHPSMTLRLYRQMHDKCVLPDERTFVIVLQACIAAIDRSIVNMRVLKIVHGFHADIKRRNFTSNIFVSNSLMCAYGKFGIINVAETIFASSPKQSIVTWNAMLSTYIGQNHAVKALHFYKHMQEKGMSPNERTYVSALQACLILVDKEEDMTIKGSSLKVVCQKITQAFHIDIHTHGLTFDAFVASTLVILYGKLGILKEAEDIFISVSHRTHVLWCAMLTAYVEQGHGEKALQLFRLMQEKGVMPDKTTFLIALQACYIIAEKETSKIIDSNSTKAISFSIGQALHAEANIHGCALDVSISTVLVKLYSKCGFIKEAEKAFNGLSEHDVICWSTMLEAYLDQGQSEKALCLYDKLKDKQTMDDIVVLCLLQACSESGSVGNFWHLYFAVVCASYEHKPFVASSLIDACGNCSSMEDGQEALEQLSSPDIVSLSSCITGYARNGNYVSCIRSVMDMSLIGEIIDEVAILSLLTCCSHSGYVHEGLEYFKSFGEVYHMMPEIKQYVTIVDLLGRAGDFRRIENMMVKMPQEAFDVSIWVCLLGACLTHNNVDLGKVAFGHAIHLQPKASTAYVLMSNVYADAKLTDLAHGVDISRRYFLNVSDGCEKQSS